MKRSQIATLLAVGLVLAYGGRLAWRAHKNIVSLDVHNMPVRDVVSKLRWQTWESITVHHDIDARITLAVEDQPLNGVLALIAEQCDSRWSITYPLYTTKARLALARKVAAGEFETPPAGWTNWSARPDFAAMRARQAAKDGTDTNAQPAGLPGMGGGGFGGPGGPGGMFGGGIVASKPVTVDFDNQPPVEAAFGLRAFGPVKVVPEDGTERKVTLSLKEAPMDTAVSRMAKVVNRKWAKLYVIEPQMRFRPTQQERDQFAQMPRPDPEQMRQMRENFQPTPDMQARATQRVLDRIKNTTAEQRAKDRQRGGRGGFGGGGGGGGGGGRGGGGGGGGGGR